MGNPNMVVTSLSFKLTVSSSFVHDNECSMTCQIKLVRNFGSWNSILMPIFVRDDIRINYQQTNESLMTLSQDLTEQSVILTLLSSGIRVCRLFSDLTTSSLVIHN